ncbi:hypothetical protein FNV43_RR07885 [Rhamnella rubrinervis]|uniref:Uncharacterized protein n=1 Tax=Rhamnella rubrinervis TaxID=2594499 RepID=A0A8K0MMU9_9ROSA|nr:hypothetical protein FNV43_RR07885 [Rhamnella rubrinervis]
MLPKHRHHDGGELKSFVSFLKWVCVDQSNLWRAGLSWSVFFVLSICVPLLSHFLLDCSSTCDADHTRPYHVPVQISLSLLATLSFFCLSRWARKYGLRKFILFDRLFDSSEKVRHGYREQLQKSMRLLYVVVLIYFAAECTYKIWWYVSGGTEIPYYGNIYLSGTIACILEYQKKSSDYKPQVPSIYVALLLMVTASQLAALLMTTRASSEVNIFKAGELALCSISLITGLIICLRSTTKVTHKAQSITGLAAKWHVCATINSFDHTDGETPPAQISAAQVFPLVAESQSDDEGGDEDDDLDDAKLVPIYAHTISYQKRQALVNYLENNRAGITVYGFVVDRAWLHSIFAIQFALLLWLLNRTIGIS